MRRILVIGIGAGNPDHITIQAIKALNRLDVVFVLDKGADTAELRRLRQDLCATYLTDRPYRVVELPDPPRDRGSARYESGVEDWHERRSELLEAAFRSELGETGTGGVLVWGDPSLYDSTLRVLDRIRDRGTLAFVCEVTPGITSLQALTAAHQTTLNQIGGEVRITTGRRLSEHPVEGNATTAVMLDGGTAFCGLPAPQETEILWGANLGTPREVLVRGRVADVADEIARRREAAKAEAGWVMDVYLLRRLQDDD